MKDIIEFLNNRPLISVHGLEVMLSLPKGTIRLNGTRDIPNKYRDKIVEVLSLYGFEQDIKLVKIVQDLSLVISNIKGL